MEPEVPNLVVERGIPMSKYSIIFQRQANYVEHRTEGHIPNCVPAVDVFIERTPEEIRGWLKVSTERYIHQMHTMQFRDFINAPLERAPPTFR